MNVGSVRDVDAVAGIGFSRTGNIFCRESIEAVTLFFSITGIKRRTTVGGDPIGIGELRTV